MPLTPAGPLQAPQSRAGAPEPPFLAQQLRQPRPPAPADPALREAFDDFVGETFYGQMLGAMRKTLGKPAYFHGGRAEEVFQGQLDQILAERLSEASASQFTGPMFELFHLQQR
ncbi:MAG TPA: rod-binding protein [Pirellulales bacterium]|nr:rod-binding protein [Pirellulales bacterium]